MERGSEVDISVTMYLLYSVGCRLTVVSMTALLLYCLKWFLPYGLYTVYVLIVDLIYVTPLSG